MSWVNALGAATGIPSAATAAIAMYAACTAAEKAARPEALKEIAEILKDSSWANGALPSTMIERVFVWTYGERQLGFRCVQRSMLASLVILVVLSLLFWHEGGHQTGKSTPLLAAIAGFMVFLIPDYFALAKTRLILSRYIGMQRVVGSAMTILVDLVTSLMISFLALCVFQLAVFDQFPTQGIILLIYKGLLFMIGLGPQPDPTPIYTMFFISTSFTSIWTILILLASSILKILAPLQRFTGWFFDLDRHPLKAVGIVCGALVMIGSFVWTILVHLL